MINLFTKAIKLPDVDYIGVIRQFDKSLFLSRERWDKASVNKLFISYLGVGVYLKTPKSCIEKI